MHCYCLFVDTNRARRIADLIETVHHIRTISPIIMQREIKEGKPREVERQWLPGYIFLYTNEPIHPHFPFTGIIRWVGRGELEGPDRIFAETVYEHGGRFQAAKVLQKGDRCVIADPIWEKIQGTIIKVDRERTRCCIAFDFDGQRRTVWVGYDLLRPVLHHKPDIN